MADRRQKLREWRERRQQQQQPSGTAAAPAKTQIATRGAGQRAPAAKRAAAGEESAAPAAKRAKENEPRQRAAPEQEGGPLLTPNKLVFGSGNKVNASSIRAKLQQSARKRRKVLEGRLQAKAEAEVKTAKKAATAFGKTPLRRESAQVKRNNLQQLVDSQITVVDDLLAQGQLVQARSFLRDLRREVQDATSVGEFWTKLAEIEMRHGNVRRACSVFAHALRACGDATLRESCSDFLAKEMLTGPQPLPDVDALLQEPFAPAAESPAPPPAAAASPPVPSPVSRRTRRISSSSASSSSAAKPMATDSAAPSARRSARRVRIASPAPVATTPPQADGDEEMRDADGGDLDAYLVYNPDTTNKKKPRASGRAARVPLPFGAVRGSAMRGSAAKQPQPQQQATGSFVSMAAVKSRPSAQKVLGNEVSLTPVRRSARLQRTGASVDRAALLRSTNYTFTPNPSVDALGGQAQQQEDLLV